MLLPDNIHPELSIYYYGAIVLKFLKNNAPPSIVELFENIKLEHDISISSLMLSLDWLYLIEAAIINTNGEVEICF